MRHIRTNHNPLTVSDILLENGIARLEDFYPLTKVKTASDKKNFYPKATIPDILFQNGHTHFPPIKFTTVSI